MKEPDVDAVQFCRVLRPRLVGSLALFCGDVNVAEDLAQEALSRAREHWERVRRLDHRDRWVLRTAFNLARSRFRRLAAERRAHGHLRAGAAEPVVLPDTAAAVAVRAAVAALPERQRATIVARFYLGLDVAEAAQVLDCKTGTIKALTHQAIASLRRSGLADLEEVTPNG